MISVIIPVYNVEKYLEKCLVSVVSQSNVDYEIICVEDGSTDKSSEILEEYARKFSQIRVVKQENQGLSAARNAGLKVAQGDFVYFLDSDDYLYNDSVLDFMNEMMQIEQLDVLYLDGEAVFETAGMEKNNSNREEYYKRTKEYGVYDKGYQLLSALVKDEKYRTQVSLYCIRRQFLLNNNIDFPVGHYYEDNLFAFKVALQAGRVMHKNVPVFYHVIRENSIMQSKVSYHKFTSAFYIWREMIAFARKYDETVSCQEIETVLMGMQRFAKSVYKKLSPVDKGRVQKWSAPSREIVNTYICEEIKYDIDSMFELSILKPGSRVVIYGAGKIGIRLYNNLLLDEFVDVIGVVDKNAENIVNSEIEILPVNVLDAMEYDYILVAVKSPELADEIRYELRDRGIAAHKIKWCGPLFSLRDVNKKTYEYIKFAKRLIAKEKRHIYLFMLPEHGNLGDYAIGLGEQKFFEEYFSKYQVIAVTNSEWEGLKESFSKTIMSDDIICITGGGYIGDVWKSAEVCKDIINYFPDNVIIFMPHTFAYANGIKDNEKVINDLKWYFSHSNLYMILREKISYAMCCESGYGDRCYLAPDMAMALCYRKDEAKVKQKVLLCFRDDIEKTFEYTEKVIDVLKKKGYRCEKGDIHMKQYIIWNEAEEYLNNKIAEIQKYDLVITDRLHGMILSWTAGVPVVAFDNSTNKVSGVYEWLKNDSSVRLCENINQFEEQIIELRGNTSSCRVNFTDEFCGLATYIKMLLKRKFTI